MSQPTPPQGIHVTSTLHGETLLQELRHGWANLPTKTLFALAMGGLRVRMMRSTVTMLSVVLAIAFLTYTGLSNKLTYNLALQAQNLENQAASKYSEEQFNSAAAALAQVEIAKGMDLEQQRGLAKRLGLGALDNAPAARVSADEQLRKAMSDEVDAQAALKKLETEAALPVELAEAAKRVATAQRQVETMKARLAQTQSDAAFMEWLRSRQEASPENAARLEKELAQRNRILMGMVATPGLLDNADLMRLNEQLDLAQQRSAPVQALETARAVLAQEQAKRSATDLQKMLRRAGVNVTQVIKHRGNTPADVWLIIMAMLTCAVGIANAMLMSVTERFREIGTMKCLGAQDNLVVKLFLLESAFLGMVGAAIGIVVGILVSVLAAVLQYAGFGLSAFPFHNGGWVLLFSVLGGVILSIGGAVYPAFAAARMNPVDALRVDE